jgi:hypothetical protein
MRKIRSRWLLGLVLCSSILFAGCSQVQPATPDETLESEALVYDWRDTSRNRGPVNSSGSLGTMRWASANNGLGPVERNTNNGGQQVMVARWS